MTNSPKHGAPTERPFSTPAAVVLAFMVVIVAFVVAGETERAYNLAALGVIIGIIWGRRRRRS
jgi:hypothetical protein